MQSSVELTIDVRLAYNNREGDGEEWKELASSVESRQLKCNVSYLSILEWVQILVFELLGAVNLCYCCTAEYII